MKNERAIMAMVCVPLPKRTADSSTPKSAIATKTFTASPCLNRPGVPAQCRWLTKRIIHMLVILTVHLSFWA